MPELTIHEKNGRTRTVAVNDVAGARREVERLSRKDQVGFAGRQLVRKNAFLEQLQAGGPQVLAFFGTGGTITAAVDVSANGTSDPTAVAPLPPDQLESEPPSPAEGPPDAAHQAVAKPEVRHPAGTRRTEASVDLRRDLDTRVSALRQELLERTEAVQAHLGRVHDQFGRLDGIGARLGAVETALAGNLSREQLRSELDSALAGQAQKLEAMLGQIRAEQDELRFQAEEQVGFVAKYKPGTIEELNQRLESNRQETERLEQALTSARATIDDLELKLRRIQATSGAHEWEEIEAQRQRLADDRRALEEHRALEVERNQLRRELEELHRLEATYRESQEVQERNRDAEARAEQLESRKVALEDELTQARKQLQGTRDQLQTFRQRIADLERERQARDLELERLQTEAVHSHNHQTAVDDERSRLTTERAEFLRLKQEQQARLVLDFREQQQLFVREDAERKQAYEGRLRVLEHAHEQEQAALTRGRAALELELRTQAEERCQHELVTLRAERDWFQRQHDSAAATLKELTARLLQAEREQVEWRTGADARDAELARAHLALADERARVVEFQKLHDQRRDEARTAEARITELQASLAAAEAATSAARATHDAEVEQYASWRTEEVRLLEGLREERRMLEEPASRAARIESIHKPYFKPHTLGAGAEEAAWLSQLAQRIEELEFQFPRRLLNSFHTSLKIAEWSPLTLLAGVSGTGKSELPRLYSQLGGMQFLLVPVQPNWDSPQNLFGFFNFVDGRYHATTLLRALVQSQTAPPDGFNDGMLVVLLDEMNLARVEYYFSELLSRLEARRGVPEETPTDADPSALELDLGAGLDPMRVRLGRNVFFTGTMNEDETTLTLSDKVLDRGNVITFPRPDHLRNRKLRPITEAVKLLPFGTWRRWCTPDPACALQFEDKLKEALDRINGALGRVRRAIGHRVLQAIIAYVSSHPDVRAADGASDEPWRRAFADQLVEKVMPKLRGIETGGKGGKVCLAEIQEVLTEHTQELLRDFQDARSGEEFLWTSARFLDG